MLRRRTLVRAGLVAAALLALLAAGIVVLKGRFEERLRADLEKRGSTLLKGKVTVESLQVGFLPPSVRLRGVRALKVGNRGSHAAGLIDSATAATGWRDLIRGDRRPSRVAIDTPRLNLTLAEGRSFHPDGADLAVAFIRAVGAAPDSSLVITNGRVELEWTGGPRGHFSGIRVETEGGAAGEDGVEGRLEFDGGAFVTERGAWEDLRGQAVFKLDRSGLALEPLSIRGEGFTASGALLLTDEKETRADGSVRIGLEAARLAPYLPDSAGAEGKLEASLSGSWVEGTIGVQGDMRAVALRLWDLQLDSLECDLAIRDGMKFDRLRAHLLGGQATGSIDVSFDDDGFLVDADLRMDGVDLAELLRMSGWDGPELTGTVHYRGRHGIASSGIESLSGSGVLDAVGHYRPEGGAPLPLEVTARIVTRGGVVTVNGGAIRAGTARGSFSGSVKRGEGIRLRLEGAGEGRDRLLPIFRKASGG